MGPRIVTDRLLQTRLGLPQLGFDLVAADVRQHLVAMDAVAQVGVDGDDLALDLARQLGLLGRRQRPDHRHRALDRPDGHGRNRHRHALRLDGGPSLRGGTLTAPGHAERQRHAHENTDHATRRWRRPTRRPGRAADRRALGAIPCR